MKPNAINYVNPEAAQSNALLNILTLGNQQIAQCKVVDVAKAVARIRSNQQLKSTTPQPQKK